MSQDGTANFNQGGEEPLINNKEKKLFKAKTEGDKQGKIKPVLKKADGTEAEGFAKSPSAIEAKENVQNRFGKKVSLEKYQSGNVLKIVSVIAAIIIIPLQIFLQSILQEWEDNLILRLQSRFPHDKIDSFDYFMISPQIILTPEFTIGVLFFLYLMTDSLIAFKTALLTCFGLYFITLLKMIYKDGRPYWVDGEIKAWLCQFDFSGPSYAMFLLAFFYSYLIIMYCMKYVEQVNKPLVISLFVLQALFGVFTFVSGLYVGTIYIYQNVVGTIYGFIYLVVCMNFDIEIHRICEKTGFVVQSSRKYKFYLFFLSIAMFVVGLIYYNSELDYWTMPQQWVVNASVGEKNCREELLETSNNRLGLDQSFRYIGIVFFTTGMGFGTSYSLVYLDCLQWVHTSVGKRLVRSILGTGISVGLFVLLKYIPGPDNPTKFFFHYFIPYTLLSFFTYGLWPVLCLKVGLVDKDGFEKYLQSKEKKFAIQDEEKAKSDKDEILEEEEEESLKQ